MLNPTKFLKHRQDKKQYAQTVLRLSREKQTRHNIYVTYDRDYKYYIIITLAVPTIDASNMGILKVLGALGPTTPSSNNLIDGLTTKELSVFVLRESNLSELKPTINKLKLMGATVTGYTVNLNSPSKEILELISPT